MPIIKNHRQGQAPHFLVATNFAWWWMTIINIVSKDVPYFLYLYRIKLKKIIFVCHSIQWSTLVRHKVKRNFKMCWMLTLVPSRVFWWLPPPQIFTIEPLYVVYFGTNSLECLLNINTKFSTNIPRVWLLWRLNDIHPHKNREIQFLQERKWKNITNIELCALSKVVYHCWVYPWGPAS